jgi:amino acid transporter
MKKSHFITLVICVVTGLIFSLGMCMCLLPEWNSFTLGVVLAAIGGVALVAMGLIALVKNNKERQPVNWKMVGKISFGVIAALILGLGMCMIMVWNLMLWGIIVGIVGLVMLLFLIPMFLGLKK